MKLLTIAMLLFFIQIAAAVVNYAEDYSVSVAPQSEWIDNVQGVSGQSYGQGAVLSGDDSRLSLGDFARGFFNFVRLLFMSLFAIPWLLGQFGVPAGLAFLFSLPVYLIYGIGIMQFITGRTTEGMR